jgi:hypothetical protein
MKSSSTCLITAASLCEGPFFYLYVESSPSTFMHHLREHSCHSEFNVYSPKVYYLIDSWLWFCLLLNYLYLAALLLESVICIYVLLLHEGQAENHFAMFFYMLEIHTWRSMHYYSWSFVCVTFHVITWLLSFIVKIMTFMPMSRVHWSQHSMLYIVDQDCVGACHLKKLLFCYHLHTRGRAGVKLGDAWYVSNISIIFYAPCLFIHHLLCVSLHFVAFLCIF